MFVIILNFEATIGITKTMLLLYAMLLRISKKINISLTISIAIIIAGIILQLILGDFPLDILKFPANFIVIIELLVIIIVLPFFFSKSKLVKYLSSPVAAISSMCLFAFHVILMVSIPQTNETSGFIDSLGFTNIVSSWSFAINIIYFLICLGLISFKRLIPFKLKNIAFFINHFGLWIVIAAGTLGEADKIELSMPVEIDQIVWYVFDKNNEEIELDFAIRLDKFEIQHYNPKIALLTSSGELAETNNNQLVEISGKTNFEIGGYKIKVLEYFPEAFVINDSVFAVSGLLGLTVAAKLEVSSNTNKVVAYVYPGSHKISPMSIRLEDHSIIALLSPEPKYFGSEISLYTKSGISNEIHKVEVNNPLKLGSWTIYQHSYDSNLGKDSNISIFSIVYDPWLPVVYIGFILLVIGGIWMMFSKINIKKAE